MSAYLIIFFAGFAGSFHCIGMCGGFACALSRDPQGRGATVLRHLLYNTGRLTTYCFLGGLAGAFGQVICTPQGTTVPLLSGPLDTGQRILAILAGLLMIAMALQFFGLLPRLHRITTSFGAGTLAASLRSLLAAPGRAAPLAFGVFNGFLPCPLVYAFAAQAASTAEALHGFLTMAAFGLGTFPALLLTGGVGIAAEPPFSFPIVDTQGSINVAAEGRVVFVVNTGDNTISSFLATEHGLQLVDRVSSGGILPVSLTSHGHVLYVANEKSSNIYGFRFEPNDIGQAAFHSEPLTLDGQGLVMTRYDASIRFIRVRP